MKEKIKFLILGIIIGAVITAGIFLVFKKDHSKFPQNGRPKGMPKMEQFEGMDFENMDFENGRPSRRKDDTESNNTSEASEQPATEEANTPAQAAE